jgi:eukaryotic-like serine/threonine-protein kinase
VTGAGMLSSAAMACLDENALLDLMQGLVPPGEAALVEEHLDTCDACRRLAAEIVKANVAPSSDPGADPAPALPLLLERGTAVARYVVLEVLGAGAMGVVYAAYDPELDRKISLKLLRTDVNHGGSRGDEARARLVREAQAMARLSHPNVAIVHDVGTFGDQVFVAMEHVDGGTLEEWLGKSPRSWREVLQTFRDAGRGLEAAHAAGLVHRDFKPSNVLVGRDGAVRVTDFGLARAEDPHGAAQPVELVGTPRYMSPEQLAGKAADARSDQFSFCVALYDALYGERPFQGDSVRTLTESVLNHELPPPPRGTRVPAWVRRVVARGLSRDPAQRYPSMRALADALSRDPAAARRRWLTAAAGACLAIAALGVNARISNRNAAVCSGADAKLAGVWDDERRAAMRSAFTATGRPFAESVYASASRTLDLYASGWAAMDREACEATRVRGEQPEELLDLRTRCLEDRRRAMGALTGLFARADAVIVQQALSAAGALQPVSSCAASEVKKPRVRPPAQEQRAAVDGLRAQMAETRALIDSGMYAPARVPAAEHV